MKKTLAIFFLLLLCISITGCDKASEIVYKNKAELVFCFDSNVSEEVASKLSKDKKELSESMKNSGIVFFGIDKNGEYTVSALKETTEFSKKMIDFKALSDNGLKEVAEKIAPNYSGYKKNENEVYIVQDIVSYYAEEQRPARQYITVKNSSFYVFTFVFNSENLGEKEIAEAEAVMNDIGISVENNNITLQSTVIILLILGISLLAVYIAITLIKDIKNRRKADN